jgi:hypothetical protein
MATGSDQTYDKTKGWGPFADQSKPERTRQEPSLMRTATLIALAFVLSLWSAASILVDVLFAKPFREVAGQLETERATFPDRAYFEQVDRSLGGDRALSFCSRDILRGAVTIRLASLEAAYRRRSPAEVDVALQSARSTLTQALQCMPNDGNFWLRLAMVNYASASTANPAAAVEEQLLASLASAPSEAWIVQPRFAFAAQMREPMTPSIERVMRADARNLVAHADDLELAGLYLNASDPARAILDEEISAADTARRVALSEAIKSAAKSKATRK